MTSWATKQEIYVPSKWLPSGQRRRALQIQDINQAVMPGHPCIKCKEINWTLHKDKQTKTGWRIRCTTCVNNNRKRHQLLHPESIERSKQARAKNIDKYKAKSWIYNLWYKYGVTEDTYKQMLHTQNGVCVLCLKPPKNNRLVVDHDHSCCPSQKTCGLCIRGLLCVRCNSMVDDVLGNGWLSRAQNYLQQGGVTSGF